MVCDLCSAGTEEDLTVKAEDAINHRFYCTVNPARLQMHASVSFESFLSHFPKVAVEN